jgi:hypothetical protein
MQVFDDELPYIGPQPTAGPDRRESPDAKGGRHLPSRIWVLNNIADRRWLAVQSASTAAR